MTPGGVNSDDITRFRADGFVIVRNFLPDDLVDRLLAALTAERAAYLAGQRDGDPRYTFARTSSLLVISNLWRFIDELADLQLHQRLARVAAALLGTARLRLYHDSLLYKDHDNGHVPWHQDEFYALLDGLVTAWAPLVAVEAEGGSLRYARGSHRQGVVDVRGMSDSELQQSLSARWEIVTTVLEPGDVLFHSGTTFHRSERNISGTPRYAFTAFFMPDGSRLRDQPFETGIVDQVYFPDRGIGELADTALNPLLTDLAST